MQNTAGQRGMARFWRQLRNDGQLHLLILLPLIYLIIFKYYPMYGAQIAFRDYRVADGITGSRWVGFDNFVKFFNNYQFTRVIRNTLTLSLYSLAVGFPIPILLALLINAAPGRYFRKSVQLITYAPYFISTVVFVSMILQFTSPHVGIYGQLCTLFGLEPLNLLGSQYFHHVYVWSGIWQTAGWSSIVYIAALANVDQAIYEAAIIDGCTRIQLIRYIDLPSILPTAIIILIVNMGYVMDVGFEKVFLMQNNLNLASSEVINTYIYKIGLSAGSPDYGYATAVGLFNSAINLFLIAIINQIAKRLNDTSLW